MISNQVKNDFSNVLAEPPPGPQFWTSTKLSRAGSKRVDQSPQHWGVGGLIYAEFPKCESPPMSAHRWAGLTSGVGFRVALPNLRGVDRFQVAFLEQLATFGGEEFLQFGDFLEDGEFADVVGLNIFNRGMVGGNCFQSLE
jgi:hypothetical protein